MACGATLKRSRELDPLMSPDTTIKRRRTGLNPGRNPFLPSVQHQAPTHVADSNTSIADSEMNSSFDTSMPEPTDGLDARLQAELRSIRARRGFYTGGAGHESPVSSDSDSEQRMDGGDGQGQLQHGRKQTASRSSGNKSDRPLFTYSQVRVICERLLKEQETRLREEYDQTLNNRLAEQYDTFVRFTYDQVHRRLGDAPMSYLS